MLPVFKNGREKILRSNLIFQIPFSEKRSDLERNYPEQRKKVKEMEKLEGMTRGGIVYDQQGDKYKLFKRISKDSSLSDGEEEEEEEDEESYCLVLISTKDADLLNKIARKYYYNKLKARQAAREKRKKSKRKSKFIDMKINDHFPIAHVLYRKMDQSNAKDFFHGSKVLSEDDAASLFHQSRSGRTRSARWKIHVICKNRITWNSPVPICRPPRLCLNNIWFFFFQQSSPKQEEKQKLTLLAWPKSVPPTNLLCLKKECSPSSRLTQLARSASAPISWPSVSDSRSPTLICTS